MRCACMFVCVCVCVHGMCMHVWKNLLIHVYLYSIKFNWYTWLHYYTCTCTCNKIFNCILIFILFGFYFDNKIHNNNDSWRRSTSHMLGVSNRSSLRHVHAYRNITFAIINSVLPRIFIMVVGFYIAFSGVYPVYT